MAVETTIVIEAGPQNPAARLLSLWRYRSFYGFLFREITMRKVRDTFLGYWWLIVRPLIPALMFILTFTVIPVSGAGEPPYPIFFLSGFITWNLFQSTVTFVPRTLLWMSSVMRRTYFPRLLVPLAGLGPTLIEALVLATVFLVLVVIYGWSGRPVELRIDWETLWILPCLLAAVMFGLAIGMVTSVVALFFRDVIFSMSYFVQMFMFLTPVIYPVRFVPEQYQWLLYVLNPMAQVVIVSRWALLGQGTLDMPFFLLSIGTIAVLFALSVAFFLRAETYLADQM